jgi:hypothetical protein
MSLASARVIDSVFVLYHSSLNELWYKTTRKVVTLIEPEILAPSISGWSIEVKRTVARKQPMIMSINQNIIDAGERNGSTAIRKDIRPRA